MITYTVESLRDCIRELAPIAYKHWAEVSWYEEKIPFDPDWEKYLKMDDIGMLHIVTARKNGELIGYYVSIVAPNLHFRSVLYASNDAIYLKPEHRGGRLGFDMLTYAFKELKELGVTVASTSMNVAYPFEKLCQAVGMQKQEYVYSIYLGDSDG